jgi:hypothetical protein
MSGAINQFLLLALFLAAGTVWADGDPLALADTSPAQAPAADSSPAPLPPEPLKIGDITVQGDLRSRIYYWDWFEGSPGTNNSYPYSGNLFRISFSQSLESVDWQLEFSVPFLLGLPRNAVAPGAQGQLGLGAAYYVANNKSQYSAMIFAKQGFVRFKHNHESVRLGRFEFLDGSEAHPKDDTLAQLKSDRISARLIGNFGFTDVQRSLDGVQYLYNDGPNTFTFVGARPTRGVFQTDGWGEVNIGVGYAALSRQWTRGAYTSETRIMGIYYDDWRRILKTDNRPLAIRQQDLDNIRIFTFGGHHIGALRTSAGTIDVVAWAVGQTGDWGRQIQRSYAYDAEAGFQPNILPAVKPWIRGAYTLGSGDNNPNGHIHSTFFQILPTPRQFALFPFYNMENDQDIMGAVILRPSKIVTISNQFDSLSLASAQDLWYSGGGAFQPWTFGYQGRATDGAKSLANLYSTSLNVRLNRKITTSFYTGYAQGLAAIRAIYPRGHNGALGYAEIEYKF